MRTLHTQAAICNGQMTIIHFKPGSHVRRKCKRNKIHYIKANANANASANPRNEKCFISLRLYLRLHFISVNRDNANAKRGFIGSMTPRRSEVESKIASSILEGKLVESVTTYRVLYDKCCADKLKKTLA